MYNTCTKRITFIITFSSNKPIEFTFEITVKTDRDEDNTARFIIVIWKSLVDVILEEYINSG